MKKSMMSFGVLLVAVLIGSYYLRSHYMFSNSIESDTINSFSSILSHSSKNHRGSSVHYHHVAVGYNTNSDLIVDALPVLKALNLKPPSDISHVSSEINSIEDFAVLVGRFMYDGSAVERSIADLDVCKAIVNAAKSVKTGHEYVGGNAALIAMNVAQHANVLLAGNLPSSIRSLLHPNIQLLPNMSEPDSSEVHLILEYQKGETWGPYKAPRANRVIVHCDRTNALIKPLNDFHAALPSFHTDLLVISGLHLLDQSTKDVYTKRLADVLEQISPSQLDPSIPVHLELASIGSSDLLESVGREIIPNVNSLGLNEQELGFLVYVLNNPRAQDDIDGSHRNQAAVKFVQQYFKDPDHIQVSKALKTVMASPFLNKQRHLERIHFHSLKFHIIAQRINGSWKNATEAVIRGSMSTTITACGTKEGKIDPSVVALPWASSHPTYNPKSPVMTWKDQKAGLEFFLAPVLVCNKPSKTVGLGDAISAAGLLHHPFKNAAL